MHYNQKSLFTAQLEQHAAIELFILPEGVGILSIALQCEPEGEDETALKLFNYRLSQRFASKTPRLMKPLREDPNAPPKPAEDAPLAQRLGQSGGEFTLPELADFLLQPLQAFDFHAPQQRFSVYSVLRLCRDVDLSELKPDLRPLLTALTHVEEIAHAGSLELTEKQLNTRHWAAVGSLGAVHLVSDQGAEVQFNQERQLINFMKYFMDFWAALAQRLILQRTLREGLAILRHPALRETEKNAHLQTLHGEVLHFMLAGYFAEVSSREAHNQYYSLARQGLRVEQNFETVRRALHDADIKNDAAFQRKNLNEMKIMQSKLEWLEVFFASYYAGALMYYISSAFFYKSYVGFTVLFWAILAGGVALWGLQPWQHEAPKLRWYQLLTPIVGLGAVWLIIGLLWFLK